MNFDILVFCDYFKPGYKAGGPISSIVNLMSVIEDNFSMAVVTRNHDYKSKKKYLEEDKQFSRKYKIHYCSNYLHLILNCLRPSLIRTKKIYVNSFFSIQYSFIPLIVFSFFLRKKVFISVRGEFADSAIKNSLKKRIYIKAWRVFFPHSNYSFIASSPFEANDIKKYFPHSQVEILSNIGALRKFGTIDSSLARNQDLLRICFISRIHPVKNLDFCLRVLKQVNKSYIFDVYGPIDDEIYFEKCLKILPFNYKDELDPNLIQDTMRNYDLFFLPTKGENFGHIIHESIMSFVPCLISDQTPWDIVQKYKIGMSYSLDKIDNFVNFINNYPNELNLNEKNFYQVHDVIRPDGLIKDYLKVFSG